MFQFHAHSKELADAVRKISIAIPPASQKGGNDGIKLALYKESKKVPNDMGVLLAYDGKIQAVSTMPIQDVSADEDMMEIHVSGRKMEAASRTFATRAMCVCCSGHDFGGNDQQRCRNTVWK